MANGTFNLRKEDIDNIINQQAGVPSVTRDQIDAILTPRKTIPTKQKSIAPPTSIDEARKIGQQALTDAEAGKINPGFSYSVSGMAEVYDAIPKLEEALQQGSSTPILGTANRPGQETNREPNTAPILGTANRPKQLSEESQNKIGKLQRRIAKLSRYSGNERKVKALQGQIDQIKRTETSTDKQNIDRILSDGYKANKTEKQFAKDAVEEYFETNEKAKQLNSANNANIASMIRSTMTPEEQEEYARMVALKNKTNPLTAALGGMLDAIPFGGGDKIQEGLDNLSEAMGVDPKYNVSSGIEGSQVQNPVASLAGNFLTTGAEYGLANKALSKVGGFDKAGNALAKGNEVVGKSLADILRGGAADIALDTIPNVVVPGIQAGDSAGQIAKDTGLNMLLNTAFNGAFEIPNIAKGIKGVTNNADEIVDAARQAEIKPTEAVDAVKGEQIPVVEQTIPKQEQAIPTQEQIIPISEQSIPTPEQIAPTVEQAVKSNDDLIREAFDEIERTRNQYESSGMAIDWNKYITEMGELAGKYNGVLPEESNKAIFDKVIETISKTEDMERTATANDVARLLVNDKPQLKSNIKKWTKLTNSLDIPSSAVDAVDKNIKRLAELYDEMGQVGYSSKRSLDNVRDDFLKVYDELSNNLKDATIPVPMRGVANEQINNFLNAIEGLNIKIPDRLRPEFADMTMKDFNNAVYFGDKKKHFKFSKNSGTPIDEVFDEIDRLAGYSLSNYCRSHGLNPDIDADQISGLLGYVNSLKQYRNKVEYTDYFPEYLDDITNQMLDRYAARKSMIDDAVSKTNAEEQIATGLVKRNLTADELADSYGQFITDIGAEISPDYPIESLRADLLDDLNAGRDMTGYIEALEEMAGANDLTNWQKKRAKAIAGALKKHTPTVESIPKLGWAEGVSELGEPEISSRVMTEDIGIPRVDNATTTATPKPIADQLDAEGINTEGLRRGVTNTAVNAGIVTPEQIATDPTIREMAQYEKHSNAVIQEQAKNDIAANGEKFKQEYLSGEREIRSDLDLDRAMSIMTGDMGEIPTAEMNAILNNAVKNLTDAGQFIQACAKYKGTAEGAFLDATKITQDTTKAWASRNKKAVKANSNISAKLKRAIDTLTGENHVANDPEILPIIRQKVVNTLENEKGWIDEINRVNRMTGTNQTLNFSDTDIDYLAHMLDRGASVNELRDMLNTKVATGNFGISEGTQNRVNELFQQAKQYDVNSKEFVDLEAEAYRLLADEVLPNASFIDKFDAWRYIAMLGNPKTMLRNLVGNKTFSAVTGISNNMAALAEGAIDTVSGGKIQRTKAVLNPVADKGLIDAARSDAMDKMFRRIEGSKYEKIGTDTLRKYKGVWDSKAMKLIDDAVSKGISDTKAVTNKYSTSLAGYMKANGLTEADLKASYKYDQLKRDSAVRLLSGAEQAEMDSFKPIADKMDKAREYALGQAEYATFHEDNAFAKWLTKISTDARNSDSAVLRGAGRVIEGIVPFKKTPANVLRSGLEYSPLGAIDSIKKTGKLIYENTGSRKGNLDDIYQVAKGSGKTKDVKRTLASDVIESWSKTLTGTGLVGLGSYLYNKGILHSSNEDTKYQDALEGKQNYSIEINGKTYTIDWAAPAVMPLLLGAEIMKVRDSMGESTEEWYKNIDNYINAINTIAEPIFETSMLSGIRDAFDTAANTSQSGVGAVATNLIQNAITGYATQAVPTAAGQIARTIDNTRRSTYTEKDGLGGTIDKQINKQMNKIPGLSMLNQPYIDNYGNTQSNNPYEYVEGETGKNIARGLGNLLYQTTSVGYLDDVNTTPADQVGWDVYNDNSAENTHSKDAKVFSQWEGSHKIDGVRLPEEDFTKYSEAKGKADFEIRNALSKSEWYNSLSSDEKGDVLQKVNTLVKSIGESAVVENYDKNDKLYQAYKNGGVDGLLGELEGKDLVDKAGINSNTNLAKEIKAAAESGDTETANKIIADNQVLSNAGLTKPSATETYRKAQETIPGLTADQFVSTFKAIDVDKTQGIKQDELIDYLNSNKLGSTQGSQIWNAYGKSSWKYIPVLEDGTWKKKKK